MSVVDPQKPRYKPGLGVPPTPSLESIASGIASTRAKVVEQGQHHKEDDKGGPSRGTNLQQYRKAQDNLETIPENGESNVTVPNPTLVDLNFGMVQPGLGPVDMEDVQFTKEDIGLKDVVITLDYPSPKRNGSSSFGLILTETHISSIRNSMLFNHKNPLQTNQPTLHISNPNPYQNTQTTPTPPNFCMVEYPSEDDEFQDPTPDQITPTEVNEVISEIQAKLSLKRRREEIIQEYIEEETRPDMIKRKKKGLLITNTQNTFAEEAQEADPKLHTRNHENHILELLWSCFSHDCQRIEALVQNLPTFCFVFN
ncbi:hypothetical protein SESBI_01599 [Sesbania bispinosa]|nr:hypothetical protein SESBI_01599 [Sesbania bispinosa]